MPHPVYVSEQKSQADSTMEPVYPSQAALSWQVSVSVPDRTGDEVESYVQGEWPGDAEEGVTCFDDVAELPFEELHRLLLVRYDHMSQELEQLRVAYSVTGATKQDKDLDYSVFRQQLEPPQNTTPYERQVDVTEQQPVPPRRSQVPDVVCRDADLGDIDLDTLGSEAERSDGLTNASPRSPKNVQVGNHGFEDAARSFLPRQASQEMQLASPSPKQSKENLSGLLKSTSVTGFRRGHSVEAHAALGQPGVTIAGSQSLKQPGRLPELLDVWTADIPQENSSRAVSVVNTPMIAGMQPDSFFLSQATKKNKSFMDKFVMAPESKRRMVWDLMGMLFLIYDVMHTPIAVFRPPDTEFEKIMGLSSGVFWTLDIGISFLRAYYVNITVETRLSAIAKHYLRREFLLDLVIASLDWSMITFEHGMANAVNYSRFFKALRIIRITRFLRLVRLMKIPRLLGDIGGRFSELRDSFGTASVSLNVAKSLILILFTNHFIACAWYYIGTLNSPSWVDTLEHREASGGNHGMFYSYITSFHWSITQFTPASMEITPTNEFERLFAIMVILIGLLMFSSFVSSITSTMTTFRVERQRRCRQNTNIRRYLSENGVSLSVGSRISAFLASYQFSSRKRVARNDITLFKALPKNLRLMIDWEVYKPVLVEDSFFTHTSELHPAGMLQICHKAVEEVSINTCEELFLCGDPALAMYIALNGTMKYFRGFDEGTPTEITGGNQRVCQLALWLSWYHTGRIFALTTCDFLQVCPLRLVKALEIYPHLQHAAQLYARRVCERMGQLSSQGWAGVTDLYTLDVDDSLDLAHHAFEEAGCDTWPANVTRSTRPGLRRLAKNLRSNSRLTAF